MIILPDLYMNEVFNLIIMLRTQHSASTVEFMRDDIAELIELYGRKELARILEMQLREGAHRR